MDLPQDFLIKMQRLLKQDYEAFLASYEAVKVQGLRVNPLKGSIDEFLVKNPFSLEKIPWTKEGYYYGAEDRPGKHPYHEAGVYYIQEPSAMAAGELADPQPGEKVLDLCAAPGGKTTHMAGKMKGQGLLLTNEIHPLRAKILSQNVERMGIINAVVTNETPARLAQRFPSFFDRILVDAPCSGEGMFRKDPEAAAEWSLENVALCAERQIDILGQAAAMLKKEGRLVYSTCTFSPEENEGVISKFLKQFPEFEIEAVKAFEEFSHGEKSWISDAADDISKTIRIWPQRIKGEGHYLAVLRKTDGEKQPKLKYAETLSRQKLPREYLQFEQDTLREPLEGEYILFGEQLYRLPKEMTALQNLKVLRPGWHIGSIKKNRFEPSHALALALNESDVRNKWGMEKDSREILSYLKGEALEAEEPKGWYLAQVDGYSIGWGKLANGVLKNHYPKGLRWTGNYI